MDQIIIDIPQWEVDPEFPGRAGPAGCEGVGHLHIKGTGAHMQIQAIAVRDDAKGFQVAVNDDFDHEIETLQNLVDARLESTKLPGLDGEWVVYCDPLSD